MYLYNGMLGNKKIQTINLHDNTDEFQTNYATEKARQNEYILYDSIYIKF